MLSYFATVDYFYASTEVAIVCSNSISEVDGTDGAVGVGRPRPDVELRILAEDGSALPTGQEGIIAIRTPWMVSGYLGNAALSRTVFQDGWFRPGDMGRTTMDGMLHITGRATERLNIGGAKINPESVDEIIQSCADVREGACFSLPLANGIDQLAVAVVLLAPERAEAVVADLQARIGARFGREFAPDKIFVLDALPRNTNGKLMRHALVGAVTKLLEVGGSAA
jgi:fatty-acyl-CoA synthase